MEKTAVFPWAALPIRAPPKWGDGPFPGITYDNSVSDCWLSPGVRSANNGRNHGCPCSLWPSSMFRPSHMLTFRSAAGVSPCKTNEAFFAPAQKYLSDVLCTVEPVAPTRALPYGATTKKRIYLTLVSLGYPYLWFWVGMLTAVLTCCDAVVVCWPWPGTCSSCLRDIGARLVSCDQQPQHQCYRQRRRGGYRGRASLRHGVFGEGKFFASAA